MQETVYRIRLNQLVEFHSNRSFVGPVYTVYTFKINVRIPEKEN